MIGSIAASYSYYNPYAAYRAQNLQRPQAAQAAEAAKTEAGRLQGSGGAWTAQRAASPGTPVQPVTPIAATGPDRTQSALLGLPVRQGADPAEMAVRMRIQPYDESSNEFLPALKTSDSAVGATGAQEAVEEGKCETCEKRKYQDGSDDMGVSFQTPTRIDPDLVASAVRGHENEHVVREQAKAALEDRKVISQSVTLHTDICPECGKVYISGGETRTVTKAEPQQEPQNQNQSNEDERTPFSVWG